MTMNRAWTMLLLPALLATPLTATAWERGKVETFATLPPGEAHPEGIAMDREGNVYVVTVAVNKPKTALFVANTANDTIVKLRNEARVS